MLIKSFSRTSNIVRRFRQRGDTIVEVLISIAVISMVLGGAYVTTNQSLKATRSAQERGYGLKLVESQIEQIKSIINTDSAVIFGSTVTPFCIYNSGLVAFSTGNCTLDSNGVPTTNEPKYNVSVVRTGQLFTVTNTWIDVGGDKNAEIKVTYRAYQ